MRTQPTPHDDYQLTSLAVAVGAISVGALAISVFSPDMVSGSEQQHMPVAAFTTWIFGFVAASAMVKLWMRARTHRDPANSAYLFRVFSAAVAAVWTVATGVALFGPEMVTGSDPTKIPFCAIFAPIVAAVLTKVGAELFKVALEETTVAERAAL